MEDKLDSDEEEEEQQQDDDDEGREEDEEGNGYNMEKLRKYQLKRLK